MLLGSLCVVRAGGRSRQRSITSWLHNVSLGGRGGRTPAVQPPVAQTNERLYHQRPGRTRQNQQGATTWRLFGSITSQLLLSSHGSTTTSLSLCCSDWDSVSLTLDSDSSVSQTLHSSGLCGTDLRAGARRGSSSPASPAGR